MIITKENINNDSILFIYDFNDPDNFQFKVILSDNKCLSWDYNSIEWVDNNYINVIWLFGNYDFDDELASLKICDFEENISELDIDKYDFSNISNGIKLILKIN
jgi:hypothetical protein